MRREKFSYDPPPFGKKSWEIEVEGDEQGREKEKSRGEKLLDEQLRQTQELIKSKGISFVDEDCRLDLEEYKREEIYDGGRINNDKRRVERYKKEWREEKEKMNERELEYMEDGEKFEKLKTIIFNKFLGDDFVTVRTSMIDDIDEGVDNIIINKETKKIVGAFDEVCSDKGHSRKEKGVSDKIKDGGGKLKYGLEFKKKEEIIASRKGDNLPLFYLQIDHGLLNEALNGLGENREEKTGAEEEIFKRLINSMYRQSSEWKDSYSLNDNLIQGFGSIYKTIINDKYLSSLLEKDN